MRAVLIPVLALFTTAVAGCGGADRGDTAANQSKPDRCIVLANGAKLCGADATTWCRAFGKTRSSRSTCDYILDRPARYGRDDFASAEECYAVRDRPRCGQWFSPPSALEAGSAAAAFLERLEAVVGEDVLLQANVFNASLDRSHAYLEPDYPYDGAHVLPPAELRNQICRGVLAMPGVKTASWEAGGTSAPCSR